MINGLLRPSTLVSRAETSPKCSSCLSDPFCKVSDSETDFEGWYGHNMGGSTIDKFTQKSITQNKQSKKKKSRISHAVSKTTTHRVGAEWVFRSKNTHAKSQKSLMSHPTRGTFKLPRGALPRVGIALVTII